MVALEPAEIESRVESWYSWLLDAMLAHTGFEVLDRSFRRGAYGTYACRRNAT